MERTADIQNLIRPDIADMEAYTPILPFEVLSEQLGRSADEIIKLDANENPYGPSPKALEALARIKNEVPIYPDPESRKLRELLADLLGVDKQHILVGSGADELIDLTMRLFISPADRIINCPPTFGMYSFDAALVQADVVNVIRRADFSVNVDAVEKAVLEHQPKLLFLTSPNNPSGNLMPDEHIDRLLALSVVIVVDQAYIEFSKPLDEANALSRRVADHPNLIVLRTFSKLLGLAGLRVGYGIYPLWMMQHLWKIKQPYNLNVAADAAARASLEDFDYVLGNLERIRSERDRMYEELKRISYLEPYPSSANFILCRVVNGVVAEDLKQALSSEGILIRYYKKPGLRDHVRISVGKPEQTDKVLEVLRRIERG